MMAETEDKQEELKKAVDEKKVEAEISIVNQAELKALEATAGAMDLKAAPCNDFGEYVCGR